jgi:magnesium transporter
VSLDTVVYGPEGVDRPPGDDPEGVTAAVESAGTTWVRLAEPSESELAAVRAATGIHPLSVEDVQNDVRPKTEEFEGHTFVLLKAVSLTRGESTFEEELTETPVGVFIGPDWLVTYCPAGEPAAVERAWESAVGSDGRLVKQGPDFAAYRVFDGLVDGYFAVVDGIETRIERIEEEVIESPGRETLAEINNARRELLRLRKVLWPSREAVGVLARGDPEEVGEPTEKYFRDTYDHLVQLVDLVETYRDLASGARDIYLNALSVSTNEVMKRLTVVAVIFLPLSLVAGVFGMNFDSSVSAWNMPELGWAYGYPAALLGMAGIAAVLVLYFRREGWL